MLDQNEICLAAQDKHLEIIKKISKRKVFFGECCDELWNDAHRIWAGLKALQCSEDLTQDQIDCVLGKLNQELSC